MDANKLAKLQEIGYEVKKCCGLCSQFKPTSRGNIFGFCYDWTYTHLKHKDERYLGVSCFGVCPEFEPNQGFLTQLHGFAELMEDTDLTLCSDRRCAERGYLKGSCPNCN